MNKNLLVLLLGNEKLLERFWAKGEPLPPQSFTKVVPHPPTSVGASSG